MSPPEDGTAARDLWESARAIRAAADLWATHHTPAGAPRSPESSRMRHPSMLGAATREWRSLVHLAADTAETTLRQLAGAAADPTEEAAITTTEAVDVEHLRSYPRPRDLTASGTGPRPMTASRKPAPRGPASQGAYPDTTVDVTVARPGRTAGSDPLVRAADVVDRLRRAAWSLAELGEAPAPALAIFASVGVLITDAAATAVLAASERPAGGPEVKASDQPDRDPLLARLLAQRSGWREASARISALRSPHPPTTILQAERLDLARQLDLLTGPRRGSSIPAPRGSGPDGGRSGAAAGDTAQALATLADRYAQVALLNLRGLREAHERGDLYVRGEALPGDAVARRPDLLEAKLGRRLVPAPSAMVTPLVSTYRALGLTVSEPQAADGTSPAA